MQEIQTKKTFIVDDDPFWTAILSEILNDLGYTDIRTLESGYECIANLDLNPSLIFLDYQMEDMNGLEVLKRVKEYNDRIGVVFCTAHENLSIAVSAMRNGSFDYLLKSNADRKEVEAIVNQMINSQVFADKIY